MTQIEKLNEALAEVHTQRNALEVVKLLITELEGVIDQTGDGMELIRLRNLKANTTTTLNTILIEAKQLAQDVAVELNDKKPHPGVLVKAKTEVLITDEKEALFYCQNHMPSLLSFDKTALKKVMKALPAEALPKFVTITTDDYATPTIVKDLGKFFES